MNSAIEAFEREFAPWALKLPAADVAARRNGQLRANGWSVLYEFGSDAYGDYLDYYAALRDATDARVNDDWHARIYETGQVVAFPAVLEAYLYGRDPSQEELDRARAPVLESLSAPEEAEPEPDAEIGTADTALWADLREVVEAQVAPPKGAPPKVEPPKVEPPRRVMSETPAEIDSVLEAAFGVERPTADQAAIERDAPEPPPRTPEPVVEKEPEVIAASEEETPAGEDEAPARDEPALVEEPAPPRRSVPGYDPFVELRTLEPKSARHTAPPGDDFRPIWQRYPGRSAGIAAGIAAVLLIAIMAMGHSGSKHTKRIAAADTTGATSAAADTTPSATQPDTQATGPQGDGTDTSSFPAPASAPVPPPSAAPAPTTSTPSSSTESTVARPVGPGSIAPIVRAHPGS